MNADIASQHALDRLKKVGFDALTEQEKTLATIWGIEAEVDNGGFAHYFASAAGDLAFYAPQALKNIGALDLAELATQANAVFGSDGPPRERAVRRNRVDEFSEEDNQILEPLDDLFLESEDDTSELIEAYLSKS
jgi:hypothetical protein